MASSSCLVAGSVASNRAASSSATAPPLRTSLKGMGSSPLDENERRLSPRGAKVVMWLSFEALQLRDEETIFEGESEFLQNFILSQKKKRFLFLFFCLRKKKQCPSPSAPWPDAAAR